MVKNSLKTKIAVAIACGIALISSVGCAKKTQTTKVDTNPKTTEVDATQKTTEIKPTETVTKKVDQNTEDYNKIIDVFKQLCVDAFGEFKGVDLLVVDGEKIAFVLNTIDAFNRSNKLVGRVNIPNIKTLHDLAENADIISASKNTLFLSLSDEHNEATKTLLTHYQLNPEVTAYLNNGYELEVINTCEASGVDRKFGYDARCYYTTIKLTKGEEVIYSYLENYYMTTMGAQYDYSARFQNIIDKKTEIEITEAQAELTKERSYFGNSSFTEFNKLILQGESVEDYIVDFGGLPNILEPEIVK